MQISYENALALAIGSNIGTTVTAIIGSLGASTDGKRLALAHLVFNVVTGILAIAGIYQLMVAVERISARLGIAADNYTLQQAVFHSLFNLIGILVMLPLLGLLVRFVQKVVVSEQVGIERPIYLSDASIEIRDAAVEAVKKESIRLYDLAAKVLRGIDAARAADVGSESVLPLDRLKLKIQEKTRQFSEGLDTLIRNELIDVPRATSLMNDISYCREICWDLVEAGATLFANHHPDERDAMRSIALDEHEITEMIADSGERAARLRFKNYWTS